LDTFTRKERSEIMRRVHSAKNASTERVILAALRSRHIAGWKLRPRGLPGSPDIFFPVARLAVFLDGCFWHGCPSCFRAPSTRTQYWGPKIAKNRQRDRRVTCTLRRKGYRVLRLWEHQIRTGEATHRLLRRLQLAPR
jgi:DNA mismatch endonuclease Vsr